MILGVVFCSPSRHLFTEILFCTLIDTDREIDTDRHQEILVNFLVMLHAEEGGVVVV